MKPSIDKKTHNQLFRPRFRHLLSSTAQHEIVMLVSRLVSVLGSSDVALDRRHTPALYSRFLSSLMVRHSLVGSNTNSPNNDDSTLPSNYLSASRQFSPPEQLFWPDVPRSNSSSASHTPDLPTASDYQFKSGSMGMDFSLPYFIKTLTSQPPASPPSSDDMEFGESWPLWKGSDVPWSQPVPISAWSQ